MKNWGWQGVGEPLTVGKLLKKRQFIDGCGLCSPGLWAPGSRHLSDGLPEKASSLLEDFLDVKAKAEPKFIENTIAALVKGIGEG